jgi:cyclophilin family peptidyl-prolyl cis-trans isomerase
VGADRSRPFREPGAAWYYDDNRFFRVAPGQWVQFGINGDPAVAKAWRTQTLKDDPFKTSNTRGTVAFAFAVPNGERPRSSSTCGITRRRMTRSRSRRSGAVVAGLDLIDNVNAEYREGPGGIRAGKQDPYFEGGNAWLLKEFPRLDYIRSAHVLR